MQQARPRDIDYAAGAVKTALEEKFGRKASLGALEVTAKDQTILLVDGDNQIEGTRDQILATVRKAAQYEEVWRLFSEMHGVRQPATASLPR